MEIYSTVSLWTELKEEMELINSIIMIYMKDSLINMDLNRAMDATFGQNSKLSTLGNLIMICLKETGKYS